jgi:hypothetical protein
MKINLRFPSVKVSRPLHLEPPALVWTVVGTSIAIHKSHRLKAKKRVAERAYRGRSDFSPLVSQNLGNFVGTKAGKPGEPWEKAMRNFGDIAEAKRKWIFLIRYARHERFSSKSPMQSRRITQCKLTRNLTGGRNKKETAAVVV